MTVINLAEARKDREPHMQGSAVCLDCKHVWQAVAPLGTKWLDCPSCSLRYGRFQGPVSQGDGEERWTCNCGNDLFHINPTKTYCWACGLEQEFP